MTTAKVVQVSADNGSTWHTLPGGSGAFNNEASQIDDTIFGQEYQSNEVGLIGWSADANALYKGFAGYKCTLKQISGSSSTMTGQAMSLVSGKTYKCADVTKNIWDKAATWTVYDGVTDVTDEVQYFDYLFGEVTFKASYTVVGSVTVDGKFFNTSAFGNAQTFQLTQSAEAIETTDFATAQANSGHRTFMQGLRTVNMELSGFYNVSAGLRAALIARSEILIEINPDGNKKSVFRGFFKVATEGQSGDVGALEEENVSMVLNVPSSDFAPCGWRHTSDTTLNMAFRIILNAWINGTVIDVRYLYDGTNGVRGDAIVTDVSLSGGLDSMNEFNADFQGTGATTAVGTG